MGPAGSPTDTVVTDLASKFEPGDVVIDGGNSHYQDDVRRAAMLGDREISYVDVGTSGGLWGLARGYCLMIGGSQEIFTRLEPIFRTLARNLWPVLTVGSS